MIVMLMGIGLGVLILGILLLCSYEKADFIASLNEPDK
jgi:hypothetical protein